MTDPRTAQEWQEAVDAAYVSLLVHAAMAYGLVTGPEVNVERCEEILAHGKDLGIYPAEDAIDRLLVSAEETR